MAKWQIRGSRRAATVLVGGDLGAEDVQRALDKTHRAIGMVAGASASDLGRPAENSITLAGMGDAVGEPLDGNRYRAQPVDTRAALSGRLRRQPVDHACALMQPTRALAERDQ